MSAITREDERNIEKRRTPTLFRWYTELNRWGWPKEIPDEELSRKFPCPRRDALMKHILATIGIRELRKHWRNPQ